MRSGAGGPCRLWRPCSHCCRNVVLLIPLLISVPQVPALLSVVLKECRDEKWRRWSLQVVETLFPLLSQCCVTPLLISVPQLLELLIVVLKECCNEN